jgi:hypothetical protein
MIGSLFLFFLESDLPVAGCLFLVLPNQMFRHILYFSDRPIFLLSRLFPFFLHSVLKRLHWRRLEAQLIALVVYIFDSVDHVARGQHGNALVSIKGLLDSWLLTLFLEYMKSEK